MKKKFFRSIAHYLPQSLLLLSVLTSNILFPATVIAQEIENINNLPQEETVPIDTSKDILKEGISTSIYEQENIQFENGTYTINNVIQGEEYVYPENDNVRVKFTEITQGGNLIIKRVELTKEQKELLNTKDNYGWDITSNMENGTFKYDLTLPNVYDNTNVEVKYTEDGNNYESIQTNSIENDRIVIKGLDHFTLFFVVGGVDDSGTCTGASITPPSDTTKCYSTIQKAIDNATSGDTINVASGTYTENIVINKAITLQGDNSNIPTINPSNTFNPILQVSTSGVTIKNIKIQGTGTNSHGISLLNGTNNLTLENVSSINNGGNGIEISLYDYQGPISNLTLNNCNLSNNNIGFRTGSTTKVKTLTITNTNAENNKTAGLYFNGPITGLTLDGGRYNNNKGSSNPTNGLGIYAVNFNNFPDGEKENMVLKNFTANGNIRGVIINQAYGPFSISNAEISNNSEEGLAVAPGANISGLSFDNIKANNNPKWGFWLISYLGYTINNVTITNSSFNISTGTSGYEGTGLYLYAATGSTLSNVNISNTSMNGNRIGLYMRTVDSTSTIRNIKAENSSFVGNTQYGAYNNDLISRTIDLTLNWWGNHTGPSGDGLSGSGDKINSNILYKEWLCQPYTTDLTRWVSQDGQCLLNAPINLGWNVSSLTSNPGEIPVKLSCGSYTKDNTPSHVWGSVAGNNIKYQRQAKAPNGGWWTDPQIYTSTYTPFIYFGQSGQGNGWEGEWNSRVRAFYDDNDNDLYDSEEIASGWSDECKITYDKTIPSTPTGLYFWDVDNNKRIDCNGFSKTKHIKEYWNSADDINFLKYEYSSFDAPNGNPGLVSFPLSTNYFDSSWWTIPIEGTYGFEVRTLDKAGNISSWSNRCNINIDWSSPTISNIQIQKSGTDAQYVKKGDTIIITAEVIDTGSGVKAVSADFSYNSGYTTRPNPTSKLMSKTGDTNTYKLEFVIPNDWNEGDLYITVAARDNLDNYNSNRSSAMRILIDNKTPSVPTNLSYTVNEQTLSCGSYTNVYDVIAKWSDSIDTGSGIDHYEYQSFNPTTGWIWPSGDNGVSVPTSSRGGAFTVGEGTYGFRVRAVDKAGNKSDWSSADFSSSCQITYDTIAPITTLSSDPSNTYINTPVSISGQTTDINGVDSIQLFYRVSSTTDWESITTLDNDNTSPYDWSYTWKPYTDGTYDIKVSGTDVVGNVEQSAYIYSLTYDTATPSITVFEITSNILNISATDLLSGVYKTEVKIDEGEWTPYTTDMNLNTLLNNTPGAYTVYVRVTDKAGNTTEGLTTYTIPTPAVLGTSTTKPSVKGVTTTKTTSNITTTTEQTDTTEEILDTNIQETSVLGEKCENKKKVSGYVYIDKNEDKEMNNDEKGIKEITLTIQYTDEQGNIKTEEEVTTDEKGYWETQLCSGKYNIVVKEDTLPKNIQISETLSLTVSDNEKETVFNIQAVDTRNFWQKYWYIIVGGIAVILIGITSIKNKKKEEV